MSLKGCFKRRLSPILMFFVAAPLLSASAQGRVKRAAVFDCGDATIYTVVHNSDGTYSSYIRPVESLEEIKPDYVPLTISAEKTGDACKISVKEPGKSRTFQFPLSKGVDALRYVPGPGVTMADEDTKCRPADDFKKSLSQCELPKGKAPFMPSSAHPPTSELYDCKAGGPAKKLDARAYNFKILIPTVTQKICAVRTVCDLKPQVDESYAEGNDLVPHFIGYAACLPEPRGGCDREISDCLDDSRLTLRDENLGEDKIKAELGVSSGGTR